VILVVGLAAVVLQTTWVPLLAVGGAAPDLVFLLVIFFVLQRRTTLGIWSAFLLGLCQDVAGGTPLGFHALILLAVAFLVGLLRTKLFKENTTAQVLILVVLTFAQQFLVFYWLNTLLGASLGLGRWAARAGSMSIYHVVLGPLLFRLLGRWIPGEDVYRHLITRRELDSRRLRLRHLG
jgi:rod shape-determining protein MreD